MASRTESDRVHDLVVHHGRAVRVRVADEGRLVVTRLRSSVPHYLAGARLLELFPMMPTMGDLTLVVARPSYAGQLDITAAVRGA